MKYDNYEALDEILEEINGEHDPSGLDASTPGAKLDSGKALVADIFGQFAEPLEAVAGLGTIGANKYSLGGWQEVEDGERRYSNAMMRHWLKERTEGLWDEDTGVLHATCVAWNALARLKFILDSLNANSREVIMPEVQTKFEPNLMQGGPSIV